ncbi:hypothetical protein CLOM_g12803 [Closterium sp. NIES-68]|nr:hypothetical protein CLOM_g5736 [Closterium sp. NIES-68]GJP53643.1 hypothetical protein CLOM_g12803 [Closterium sp. NIES-68]GJP73783.1 hypothetical protein CLOP_g4467 [Closterium sp. NIES-67]
MVAARCGMVPGGTCSSQHTHSPKRSSHCNSLLSLVVSLHRLPRLPWRSSICPCVRYVVGNTRGSLAVVILSLQARLSTFAPTDSTDGTDSMDSTAQHSTAQHSTDSDSHIGSIHTPIIHTTF